MSYLLTPLQRDFASATREFLSEHATPSPSEPERSSSPELWKRIGEMGWTGLLVAEEHGGLGGSLADLEVVLEEAGRVLLGVPLADTAVVAAAIAELAPAGWAGRNELLARLAAGDVAGTTVFDGDVRLDGGQLHGTARFVIHGHSAGVVLLLAGGDEPALLLLGEEVLDGARRRPIEITDLTRPLAEITFDGVEAPGGAVLASGRAAVDAFNEVRARRAVALAAEAVGGAEQALATATLYAKERKQFGRPIGSFQAVKHKLANLLVLVEHARTAARRAARTDPTDAGTFLERAAVAKAYCGDAYVKATADSIQVHGGIGFTWEHPAHLYYKRASVDAGLVWSGAECRQFVRRRLFG